MEIVVNHLTRMTPGYICVAGLDRASGRHVRPVLDGTRVGATLLVRNRGVFDVGTVVDLGPVRPVGHAPEHEDYLFNRWKARHVRTLGGPEFWEQLVACAAPDLVAIFGPELQANGRGATVDLGKGRASLGCLRGVQPLLHITREGKLRARFADAEHDLDLSVTDLRFYEDDHRTVRRSAVDAVRARLAAGVPVVLSVGLGRPFLKDGDSVSRHWLQVNNVHLADDPVWQDCTR